MNAFVLYQVGVRSKRPPRFSRGGETFGAAAPRANSATRAGVGADSDAEVAQPSRTPPGQRTSAAVTRQVRSTATPTSAAPVTSALRTPALGTYTYAVRGTEGATGFGSRDFPPQMTMVVSREPKLPTDQLQFDLTYSSDHEERQILAYRPDGVFLTYEAGSVTFTVTQTSEAAYTPAMLQVPHPLAVGATSSGTSTAKDPGGNVVRVIDWTVRVSGTEAIDAADQPVDAWVVHLDRKSRPGTSEQETRRRTGWFDASRGLWVKWTDSLQASRSFGPGSFSYNEEVTVTLQKYSP